MTGSTAPGRRPQGDWPRVWRGRWIWDAAPSEEAFWWKPTPARSHFTYLRCVFDAERSDEPVAVRVTCDSRYLLFVNGTQIGRGPVRAEPELLGWDEYRIDGALRSGRNVVVALCHYYGAPGPWWVPAPAMGTLGRGSFCFETDPHSALNLVSGAHWQSVPAPWIPTDWRSIHSFPPEMIDGRAAPARLHDPDANAAGWPAAVVLSAGGHGTVLDRPPAAPYTTPSARPIPHLTSTLKRPQRRLESRRPVTLHMHEDPRLTWNGSDGEMTDRLVSVWDMGEIVLGHVRLTVRHAGPIALGEVIDVVAGEELRDDGLPQSRPRDWAARYLTGPSVHDQVTFFDPVGLRYLAVHHGADRDLDVDVEVEESIYPRPPGAAFDSDDSVCNRLWQVGARTVDVCSSDAFMDCPGREQRAWIADAYVEILVSLVTNPDPRLVQRHLTLTSRSRRADGLLAGAAACDFAHSGLPTPEYSLHWIRSLAAYWRYRGDETAVRELRPIADAIIERYECQRGSSGLLEEVSGWVFIDWAQVERDMVIGAHDALYAAALRDYAGLPGAADVSGLLETSAQAFEQLWDAERHAYVDAIGAQGRGRRISQHTNATALLAGIVPSDRAARLIERIVDPSSEGAGRLVVTAYPGSLASPELIPNFQYAAPDNFDPEHDVVAAQPWFCRFLHEALFLHGRRDLVLESLRRWPDDAGNGTFQEFWEAESGRTSRCHGWSASPTFDLTSYVLGVRPLSPGYRRAIVDPHLGGLSRASGRVPTPLGWLSVAIEGQSVRVEIPEGMVAEVGGTELVSGTHTAELPHSLIQN